MILLTGVTGHLGSAALSHVRHRLDPSEFAVLARNGAKAQPLIDAGLNVRIADFDDPSSLPDALSGVDTMLFVSTMSMERGAQQRAVVDAAAEAGVGRIVYTGLSVNDIDTSHTLAVMQSHFDTEDHIRKSGVDFTFLRNTMYAEALLDIAIPVIHNGVLALPGGAGRVPYALRSELGEAAAAAVLGAGHSSKTYELTGPQSWSYHEVADALSSHDNFGAVTYQPIDEAAYAAMLEGSGLPPFMQQFTIDTVGDVRDGQYDRTSKDLAALLGREPAGLSQIVSSILS